MYIFIRLAIFKLPCSGKKNKIVDTFLKTYLTLNQQVKGSVICVTGKSQFAVCINKRCALG